MLPLLPQRPKLQTLPLLSSTEKVTELPHLPLPPRLQYFLTSFPRPPPSPPYTSLKVRTSLSNKGWRQCEKKYLPSLFISDFFCSTADYKSCHGSVQSLMTLDPHDAMHSRKTHIRCSSDVTAKHSAATTSSNGYQKPGSVWVSKTDCISQILRYWLYTALNLMLQPLTCGFMKEYLFLIGSRPSKTKKQFSSFQMGWWDGELLSLTYSVCLCQYQLGINALRAIYAFVCFRLSVRLPQRESSVFSSALDICSPGK